MFLFRRKKETKAKYQVDSENLAVPEVHTGEVAPEENVSKEEPPITYDDVAMPEIHIRRKKK